MAVTIVTRAAKGAALTHNELDQNFTNLKAVADGLGTSAVANLTTSTIDATPGKVLKVGDFGMGSVANLLYATDLNDPSLPTGIYGASGAAIGAPTFGSGYGGLEHLSVTTGTGLYAVQVYHDYVTPIVATRVIANGVIGAWVPIFTRSTILGTVSQSAGVPTGAIIERGSNANGEYAKFADGTLLCWTAPVIGYTMGVQVITPLPITFVGNVSVGINNVPSSGWDATIQYYANVSDIYWLPQITKSLNAVIFCVFGRWF